MEIDALKSTILTAFKKVFSKAKAVTRLPFFKSYAVLAILLTMLFTIITFPYEVIVLKQLHRFEGKDIQSIIAKEMDVNLIGKSSAGLIDIIFRDGESLQINDVTADLSLNPFALMKKKFEGSITAERVIYNSDKLRVVCNPSCNINIQLNESGQVPSDGQIKAIVDNLRITSEGLELAGGFMLPASIRAASVNAEAEIVNMTLNIINFTISGNDLSGRITGSIILMPIIENSKLNLKISIDPESGLLEGFRPLLRQFVDISGKISFPLTGTITHPKAVLNLGGGKERVREENSATIPPFESEPEM